MPSIGASQVVLIKNPVKNPLASAGEIRGEGSIPGPGRSPGRGHGNLLQYSCLENLMKRGAWQATVHGVTKSWTLLKRLNMHACKKSRDRAVPINRRAKARGKKR